MPNRKIEAQLEALSAIRKSGLTEESQATLRKALADSAGIVNAKAADVISEMQAMDLIPELLKAYHRLFEQGPKRDPQCWGKISIANALKALDHSSSETFVRALTYQQWEPVWGTEVDTAAPLRAVCILALAQCSDLLQEESLWLMMRALTDAAAAVRLDAVRALNQMEGREVALLLRLKARMGDIDAAVTGQILQSLLGLEGPAAVPFVSEFFFQRGEAQRDSEVAEQAALALGLSRLPAALDVLMEAWERRMTGMIEIGAVLRAISASRQEPSLSFLLSLVGEGRQADALAAIEALGLHRDSETIRARVAAAVRDRDNQELEAAFLRAFN